MTSSSSAARRRRAPRRAQWSTIALCGALLASCSGDGPVAPPAEALCDGVTQAVISLARYEAQVLSGNAVHCAVLAGAGASYLVMPQLTGSTLPYGGYGFRIGDPDVLPNTAIMDAATMVDEGLLGSAPIPDAQALLDARLRTRERSMQGSRPQQPTVRAGVAPPHALDSLRRFSVLSTLDATPAWAPVDARLRFNGSRVAIYVDTVAGATLTDGELQAMGALYDGALAPRVFDTFGAPSDIDGDGRVLFVLSPRVNAMVTSAECATRGFVRGFFYGHDLSSTAATSNRGEVFYAYVPDPGGVWSCSHSKDEVLANLPPTFIHELQHMVSFGAHTVLRGGASEEAWLNEGLSHVAEELGSLYWETRFPPPTGRANASQLFPDSAAPYINPNLLYSYRFLFTSGSYSLTACAPGSFCSLNERGGAWIFLRWIADQKGEGVFRQLVQTALTGRTNLEAVAGESTAALLADFAIAVSADSLEGVSRSRIAARYKFASRNFRSIYLRLFEAYGIAGGVGRPFPIAPIGIAEGTARTGTMRPGTFLTYSVRTGTGTPAVRLRFSVPDGSAFQPLVGAQVSIFRID